MLKRALISLPFIEKCFWLFSIVVLSALGLSLYSGSYYFLLLPVLILGTLLSITDYKKVFFLFFAAAPFSIELFFDNGLGTDMPTEPLALLLTAISILLFINRFSEIKAYFLKHPISLILILHLVWIFFTSLHSQNQLISFKYFFAKIWYVIPFYALPMYLFKDVQSIEKPIRVLLIFTSLITAVIFIRHAGMDFTFKSINKAAHPMFRNHVIYAALLVLLMPFVWYFHKQAKKKLGWIVLAFFMLVCIYLTYTRAAYVCVAMMFGAYFIIKYRFARIAVSLSLIVAGLAVISLVNNNKYLDFAPEYKKTVTHYKFDNLIEATYKLEDISTMERVYRWVAGLQMVKDKPGLGFGPACFYSYYKEYVVSSFRTYVSDNPDKSGIHNYFFMVLVEQGFIGLIIVLFMCVFPVLYGERLFHKLKNPKEKDLVMAVVLCLIAFDATLIINDLIETDKLGSFFWFNLSILVILGAKASQNSIVHLAEDSSH